MRLFLPANFEFFLKRLTDSLFENFRYRGTSKNDSLHMFVPDLVVEPSREQRDIDAATAGQLLNYMTVSGASRGALVYMTPGMIRWVERENRT